MEGNGEKVKAFSTFLATLPDWGPYEIDPWIAGRSLCHLKGRHTKVFIDKIELVIQKLNNIIIQSDIRDFIDALRTFYSMSRVLRLTRIDLFGPVNEIFNLATVGLTNESSGSEIATAVMEKYVSLAKFFNSKGHVTFMNTSYNSGDEEDGHGETFYMHVLRYYAPKIMQHTFQKHGVGPGVFTMEGFEYVNYVSKMVHRTRTNKKVTQLRKHYQSLL